MRHISPELAILISCVGRKLILKQRIEEEVEGVRDILGKASLIQDSILMARYRPLPRAASANYITRL